MDIRYLERGYFTPNDDGILAESDSISIQNAVDAALSTGLGKVVIPPYNTRTGKCQWDVDKAVILDSNLEIVLDNCYIRQMDGSMDNVFRNYTDDDHLRLTLAEEQHNIVIRGLGNAMIDGGIHNGLTERSQLKNGLPSIRSNNVFLLHNLRDFRLENFTIRNQRWWAINLYYAEKGRISGLNIICDNGAPNLDGVDVRIGCNNIIIENMSGYSGDDYIALTGLLHPRNYGIYGVEGKSYDIHDIIIRNIAVTAAECALVALRNQDGVQLYNITIDTVHDVITSQCAAEKGNFVFGLDNNNYKTSKSPYALLRIGHDDYITVKSHVPGDTHSIYVNNIHARCNHAIILNMDLDNSVFSNVYAGKDVESVVATHGCRNSQPAGVNLRNTVFENIFFESEDRESTLAFDFCVNTKERTMENVRIRNAYLGACSQAIRMDHKGTLMLEDIRCDGLEDKITVCDGGKVLLDGREVGK